MTAPTGPAAAAQGADPVSSVLARIAALQRRIDVVGTGSFATTLAGVTAAAPATATTAPATLTPTTTAAPGGVTGDDVVAGARSFLGVPYVFAGTSRDGIDCSGLVQRVYGDLGIKLPRLSWDQAEVGTAVPSLDQARPGDIVCFGTPAHHVGIYVGGGKMIAAPQPGEVVKLQDVYETPSTIRRVLPDTPAAAGRGSLGIGGIGATAGPTGISPAVQAFASTFRAAETRYGLPTGLLSAVAQAESGGNTAARSPAGALGLMQLMPATAAALGVDPLDPTRAVDGAARLLQGHLARFGSVPLALAAYNAGGGAVERYGGVPPYRETQDYVRKITAMLGIPAA